MVGFVVATLAGLIVGIINGMAGGASIISYPVLLALGLHPLDATITNALGTSSANFFAIRILLLGATLTLLLPVKPKVGRRNECC